MGVAVSITAGLGAALLWNAMTVPADRSEKPAPGSEQAAGIEDEALAQLKNYLRAVTIHPAADSGEKQSPLPDVGTMIERLAVRLQAAPSDVHGWRMLGWSYYHTAQYEQAVAAYERALMLDPQSDELRLSLETARAKADGADAQRAASPSGGSE
jgi:cytochrome c-type biogenesis protein CcmH